MFFESGGPIEVAYAKATLHAGDRGYGLLLTTWGAGAVLGSVDLRPPGHAIACRDAASRHARDRRRLHRLRRARRRSPRRAPRAVGGIGNGCSGRRMISTVQRITPQELQGRMMGGLESLGALCLASGCRSAACWWQSARRAWRSWRWASARWPRRRRCCGSLHGDHSARGRPNPAPRRAETAG